MNPIIYRFGSAITILLLPLVLSSQSTISLYPEGIPCANALPETTEQNEYMGTFVTSVHEPLLVHYAPVPQISTGASVMVVPGGGYTVLAWSHEGEDIARRLTTEGLHVFVLRYRLPRHESPECRSVVALADAQRGVKTIRLLADSLGLNHERVAVLGFSAGGHLAGSAAVHAAPPDLDSDVPAEAFSSRPNLSVLVYPVLIMEDGPAAHQGSINALLGPKPWPEEALARYNLPARVHPDVPSTMLIHAGDDTVVPVENSLRYYAALKANDVPAELRVYAKGGHGFGSAAQTDLPAKGWLPDVVTWFQSHGWVR